MNGKHEVRLERIEQRIEELYAKMDAVVEQGAVTKADIVWLKWAVRGLIASALGLGGAAFGGFV